MRCQVGPISDISKAAHGAAPHSGRIWYAFMNLEGIHVLLVEDNPGDARLFLELVRDNGRRPLEAGTCRPGFRRRWSA